jgi:alcohol dehydrogenase class IV
MHDVGAPSGIAELGYGEDDVPELVEGALKQERLLSIAPKEPGESDLAHILNASMRNW